MIKKQGFFFKSLVVFIGLLLLAGCSDPKKEAAERLKFGIELFEKEEFQKARLEIRSALQEDDTIAEAYYYLALINEKDKKFLNMKGNLEKVLKLDSQHLEARVKLAKLFILANDLEKAKQHIDKALEVDSSDKSARVLRATFLTRKDAKDEAKVIVEDVLQEDPIFVDALVLKAMLFMQDNQLDDAEMVLQPSIDQGADDIPLFMLKILIDSRQDDFDGVVADYQQLIKLYPKNDQLQYSLAKVYLQGDKEEEAEKVLLTLIEKRPKQLKPKFTYLEFLFYQDFERGKQALDTYIEQYQNDPEKLLNISSWMLQHNMFDDGRDLLNSINTANLEKGKKKEVELLRAKAAFQKRDYQASLDILEKLLEEHQSFWAAMVLKAKVMVARQQYDDAVQILKKVFFANPKSDETLLMLAQIDLIKKDPVEANKKMREILTINPANLVALQHIVKDEISKNNLDYADELVTRAVRFKPTNVAVLQKDIQVKLLKQDWETALTQIRKLDRLPKGKLPALYFMAKFHQDKNDCDKAIPIYKSIMNKVPMHMLALQNLAVCYLDQKHDTELIRYLKSFIEKNPKQDGARIILSNIYRDKKEYGNAKKVLTDLLQTNKKSEKAYVVLSRINRLQGKMDSAIAVCQQGLKELPNNLSISLELAIAYEKYHKYEKALSVYESLFERYPEMDLIANNYAAILVDHGNGEQSIKKAKEIADRFKKVSQPYYLDTYAWVLVQNGEINEGLSLLKEINTDYSDEAVFRYHLGVAYLKQGNKASALVALQQALDIGKKQGDFAQKNEVKKLLEQLKSRKRG